MLIGMPEVARRLGLSDRGAARRALLNAGVAIVRINEKALAVEESDLAAFIASRAGYAGRGRPKKEENDANTTSSN